MNDELGTIRFADLLAEHQSPCVSIYQPMQRANPPAAENPRWFRDMIDAARQSMRGRYDEGTLGPMTQKIESIASRDFFEGDRDAVAIFASPDHLKVVDLLQPVDPLVVVADSFHIKPLIRIMQMADRFQVLCLERKSVRMFEGNRWRLEKLDGKNVPQDAWQVAGMTMS